VVIEADGLLVQRKKSKIGLLSTERVVEELAAFNIEIEAHLLQERNVLICIELELRL